MFRTKLLNSDGKKKNLKTLTQNWKVKKQLKVMQDTYTYMHSHIAYIGKHIYIYSIYKNIYVGNIIVRNL